MSQFFKNLLSVPVNRKGTNRQAFARGMCAMACVALSSCTAPPNWQQLPQRIIHHTAFRHYASVSRSDGSIRHMLIDEATLQHWQPGHPLPKNALIVMQTDLTPGRETTNFTKHMEADGYFTYGSFNPITPNLATGIDNTCASCHDLSDDAAGTYTAPLLNAAIVQGQLMTTYCDRAGRIPCEREVYRNFVAAPVN